MSKPNKLAIQEHNFPSQYPASRRTCMAGSYLYCLCMWIYNSVVFFVRLSPKEQKISAVCRGKKQQILLLVLHSLYVFCVLMSKAPPLSLLLRRASAAVCGGRERGTNTLKRRTDGRTDSDGDSPPPPSSQTEAGANACFSKMRMVIAIASLGAQ